MQESQDSELLRQYARENSDEAFAALVTRHVNLVYSAALRKTGNPAAAEEMTQAVFIILARKANGLLRHTALSGWLYQAARLTAANFLRTEIRRARREQEAYMQSLSNETEPEIWPQIVPLLDDAMGRLGEKDRNAVVLRFFEGKSFQEIGAAFGVSENAARKRADHALEKLRIYFFQTRRGFDSRNHCRSDFGQFRSSCAAGAGQNPLTAVALAKGATASTSTLTLIKGALKIMAWTKAKTAIVASVVVLLAAGTTTVTVKEIQEHSFDDSWRTPNLDSKKLDQVSPQVRIVPTKIYSQSGWARNNRMKVMGVGESLPEILGVACGFWSPARTIISAELPETKFDF